MYELTIARSDLNDFVSGLMARYEVIAPVAKEDRYAFERLDDPARVALHYDTTILPPVKWIYPNNETLLTFHLGDAGKVEPVVESKRQALLFLHPCDINGINIMDEILAEEPADVNYLARRRETVIIGYECFGPCRENTLCYDKGFHRAERGYDLLFSAIGERYYVHAATDTGRAVAEGCTSFKKVSYRDRLELQKAQEKGATQFSKQVKGDMGELSSLLKEKYDDTVWVEEGERCLSCGACNIVCPTCYCFDVVDEVDADMESGRRVRRWDSCQLHGFCKVASGENFRESAAGRVRHRIFKKEVYLKKRFGRSGCVGCGRCITSCIADISILEIYNRILERGTV